MLERSERGKRICARRWFVIADRGPVYRARRDRRDGSSGAKCPSASKYACTCAYFCVCRGGDGEEGICRGFQGSKVMVRWEFRRKFSKCGLVDSMNFNIYMIQSADFGARG